MNKFWKAYNIVSMCVVFFAFFYFHLVEKNVLWFMFTGFTMIFLQNNAYHNKIMEKLNNE